MSEKKNHRHDKFSWSPPQHLKSLSHSPEFVEISKACERKEAISVPLLSAHPHSHQPPLTTASGRANCPSWRCSQPWPSHPTASWHYKSQSASLGTQQSHTGLSLSPGALSWTSESGGGASAPLTPPETGPAPPHWASPPSWWGEWPSPCQCHKMTAFSGKSGPWSPAGGSGPTLEPWSWIWYVRWSSSLCHSRQYQWSLMTTEQSGPKPSKPGDSDLKCRSCLHPTSHLHPSACLSPLPASEQSLSLFIWELWLKLPDYTTKN